MPDDALETCCERLREVLPDALTHALARLNAINTEGLPEPPERPVKDSNEKARSPTADKLVAAHEEAVQAVLTTVERLMKVAKLAADASAKADPDGTAPAAIRLRELTVLMTSHLHTMAERSPYASQIRELLE